MESLKIILLSVAAGIVYGIIHDQITARICLEYFTVFHPRIIDSESPTLLGLAWGVIATWWAGAFLGTMLAIAARGGSRDTLQSADLVLPISRLLVVMAGAALMAGCAGYMLCQRGFVSPPAWITAMIPVSRSAVFMADWWAHIASYASAFLGGLVLCTVTYNRRAHIARRR